MKITNTSGLSLPVAIWLAQDDYDHQRDMNYISATTLLKSTKQIILPRRVPIEQRTLDVVDLIPSRFGTALHDSIEKAWTNAHANLKKMGYPDKLIERVIINPTEEDLASKPNVVPVYVEQRMKREIAGWVLGGKFDMVLEEELYDFKSTSVWSWIYGSKDEDYQLQGSIYRWLNPKIILGDHIHIQFIFTDWSKSEAKRNPNGYPQSRILSKSIQLLSLAETEKWISAKLQELSRCWKLPENQIPPCNDKELWRSDPVFKYFSDPSKTDGRSTKNFPTLAEANAFCSEKGKGVVITKPGEVKACGYCAAYDICEQRKAYDV